MAQLFQLPKSVAIDSNLKLVSGAKAYFYQTLTNIPQDTYADSGLTTPNSNPVNADSAGVFPPIWLDETLIYGLTLKTLAGVLIYTVDPIGDSLARDLADGSNVNLVNSAVIKYDRTAAEISAGVIPVNSAIPSHASVDDILIERYGGGASATAAANVIAVTSATAVASALGGGTVRFPSGILNFNGQIVPLTFVDWVGSAKFATTLNCTAADGAMPGNIFIEARGSGSGGFPADRKIISIRHMSITGLTAGNNVRCFALGWNMRSMDLLFDVRIADFGHYGIAHMDQNWNLGFSDIQVEGCGSRAANSSGLWKDPAVDGGVWNYITHTRCQFEGNGSTSSTAGGINLQTTTANRGLYFTDCIAEGNFGTDEVYITNMSDLQVELYVERENVQGQLNGIELSGCSGVINGRYIASANFNYDITTSSGSAVITGLNSAATTAIAAGSNGGIGMRLRAVGVPNTATIISIQPGTGFTLSATATASGTVNSRIGFNLSGLILEAGSEMQVMGADTPNWILGGLDIRAAKANTGRCKNTFPVALDADGQISGDIAPRVSANKNATNQTGIATATFTKVTFGTERYDETSAFTGSTFTPRTVGKYQVNAAVKWTAAVDATRCFIAIYVNGAAYKTATYQASGTGEFSMVIGAQVDTNATTDTIEIYARQDSGSNKDISGAVDETYFMAALLGP